MKLGQLLASSHPKQRQKGLEKLEDFLMRQKEFSEKEMYQIWHAIHYSYWITDTEEAQDAVCATLGGFLHKFASEERCFLYIKGFWFTMCSQWPKMDCRINKYMYLVRVFFHDSLEYLCNKKWNAEVIAKWAQVLEQLPLDGDATHRGVCGHLCDVFLVELNKVLSGNLRISFQDFCNLMEPFLKLQSVQKNKFDAQRCKRRLFAALITQATEALETRVEDNLESLAKLRDLVEYLFKLARKPEIMPLGRRRLYSIRDDIVAFLALVDTGVVKRKLENAEEPEKKKRKVA